MKGTPGVKNVQEDGQLDLEMLLPFLRKHGVVKFTHGAIHIEFGALPAPAAAPEAPAPQAPALAPCGHEWHEQSDAGCLHGCAVPEAAHAG